MRVIDVDLINTRERGLTLRAVSKVFGGALLVSGTCIGAGMLGLPVSTAASGFYPTLGLFLICWCLMTLSAFLMLEVSLWFKNDTNLISMAHATLGKKGEVLAWVTYVLFLYALMAAYTAGGGGIAGDVLVHLGFSKAASTSLYVCAFGGLVYCGARWVDIANRGIMIGLLLAYFGLVYFITPHVEIEQIRGGEGKYLWFTLPLLVTSFGFHLLIPTLKTYFNGQVKPLRLALLLGSLIPLIVYLAWEWIVLGTIPLKGDGGLIWMLHHGNPAVELSKGLQGMIHNGWIAGLAKAFSFFAILSSFIGVALGLFDFFADGFKIKKNKKGRFLLVGLTFIPPFIFASIYPKGFLLALSYAGVFAAVLLVIFPGLLVWYGRYRTKIAHGYQVKGGKLVPIIVLTFGLIVIATQIFQQFNFLPMP
jgi:tyrosine-specific transport protein